MTDKLVYKDFIGSIHFSADDEIFYGKIEGLSDLVTFEGESVKKLQAAFRDAVNDYISLCKLNNKAPLKSFKGSFNVRISPKLHSIAFKKALLEGKSLNEFVEEAIVKATI
ncbi:MAG: type II toxin-antitoxin system HicB family antitoxin [Saprospiraceae bacterium]|nr:type II toxin-antitoxin system HicB family antitoxin [Saprospiraceae bacterium]